MRKFAIFLTLVFFLTGCSVIAPLDNNVTEDNNQTQQDKKVDTPPVEEIAKAFYNSLFPNLNVVKTKDELISSLLNITNKEIANKYVNYFYFEKRDGLKLNHHELLFINPTLEYQLEMIDENDFVIRQNNISETYGKYNVALHLKKESSVWHINDIDLKLQDNLSYLNVTEDLQSILLLVNKHHNLPDNYIPEDLEEVQVPFPSSTEFERKLLRAEAAKHLEEMFEQAKQDNIILYGRSGYRSYQTQEVIFAYHVDNYGSEEKANQVSAYPGQSEHQTGLTIDVTSKSVNYNLTESFGETKEGKWLKDNAHRFGFIIRYPKGKEGITEYSYEPWHIRYVGEITAQQIWEQGITYEEYLEMKSKK